MKILLEEVKSVDEGSRDYKRKVVALGRPRGVTALLIDVCSRRGLVETDRGIYLPHIQLFSSASAVFVGDSVK